MRLVDHVLNHMLDYILDFMIINLITTALHQKIKIKNKKFEVVKHWSKLKFIKNI